MPAGLKIVGYALERLMRAPDQQLFFGRGAGQVGLGIEIGVDAMEPFRVLGNEPVNFVQESRGAFNSLLVPFQVFFRGGGEERVHASGVAAILVRHFNRADKIAFRLGHLGAVFEHHALREEPFYRLAMIHQAEVVHHLAEEPGINQMQNRVFHAANVLIDLKPIRSFRFIKRRAVVVRVGIAIEIPRGVDEGIHRVRFAARGPAALRANRVHEFRHARRAAIGLAQ